MRLHHINFTLVHTSYFVYLLFSSPQGEVVSWNGRFSYSQMISESYEFSSSWKEWYQSGLFITILNFSILRSSHEEVFCVKGFLRNSIKLTGKHVCQSLFFNKKETLAQLFSCKFCGISKKTFSYRTPLVDASASSK